MNIDFAGNVFCNRAIIGQCERIGSVIGCATLYRWNLEHHDRSFNLDVDGPMTLGNTNLMIEASLGGIGISWVPAYYVEEHVASGRLVQLLSEWSPTMPSLCFYYPANRHPPVALRLFTEAIRDWQRNSNHYDV